MRKTILLFSGILITVFVLLSWLDNGDYALEKRLWRINKAFNVVAADPQIVSPQQFRRVMSNYEGLLKKYPNSKETPTVLLQIGRMYALKQEWPRARESFQVILEKYSPEDEFCAQALREIGKTYEAEGNSTAAKNIYQEILEKYPLTAVGLNIPLHIISYYESLGDFREAKEAVHEAVYFYQQMADKLPVSYKRFMVLRKLTTVYVTQENWVSAIETLEHILMELPRYQDLKEGAGEGVIKSINSIAVLQLKDYNRPILIFREFIQHNPRHYLTPKIQDLVSALEQLKEQQPAK